MTVQRRDIGDPNPVYESLRPLWDRCRAACGGEKYIKAYDSVIDTISFGNLLIPFSPSMTQAQYSFYKSEAEWPGIVAQYAKVIVGGLLRKKPELTLPDSLPEDAKSWIYDSFGEDNKPLISFLDEVLWEELQTSRAWVYVDYPRIANAAELTDLDFKQYKPYPVLWKSESIINWQLGKDALGTKKLLKLVYKCIESRYSDDEINGIPNLHPTEFDVLYIHELVDNKYQIRKFEKELNVETPIVNGRQQLNTIVGNGKGYVLVDTINVLVNGKSLEFIPAWPLNGCYESIEPILTPLVDKEVSIYNKLSRRNHLLYGASTYTPVIIGDISEEKFDEIVDSGLGTWINLPSGSSAEVLKTPTEALTDMDRAIAASIEEMAKLGVRMLTPETAQSGIALDIRNAAQTAQLGTLNAKISHTMSAIIAFMLNWKYRLQLTASDVKFTLSADFNPTPLGADWLRLATEWYENGLIPRSLWLTVLKHNDLVPAEYNDEEGQQEITDDEIIMSPAQDANYKQAMSEHNMQLAEASQNDNRDLQNRALDIKEKELKVKAKSK